MIFHFYLGDRYIGSATAHEHEIREWFPLAQIYGRTVLLERTNA